MDILVLGHTGFIGGRVAQALAAAGHRVQGGARATHDFTRLATADAWLPLLAGCQGVVNAVGIFRESGAQTFRALHVAGPVALFEACARLRIPVVQVSALGADVAAPTAFLRTKGEADARLLAMRSPATILRPSLVFGLGGESAAAFLALASLPLVPLPGRGTQRVQPVHVDDLADAVVRAFADGPRGVVDGVGPRPMALREYLAALRRGLGLDGPRFIRVPGVLVRLGARLRAGLLDRDALEMLEHGSTAEAGPFAALLGRPPRAAEAFVEARDVRALRTQALLGWLLPVMRLAIAVVWLTAGVVSAGLYPVEQSRALLAQVGLDGLPATLALAGAVALDTVLGIATLALPRRHWLWNAQLLLIVAYTGIITVFLPEQWLHPFGPVVKNLPMLAGILLLRELERR